MDSDCLSHYLKIWSDKWGCTGETKGGTVQLRHSKLVVTSNYSIEQLFVKFPYETVQAISRRFEVIEMKEVYKPD